MSAPSRLSLPISAERLVALGFEGFGLGDGVAAAAVDGGEVAEDGGGVHAAGAEFFFDEGQIGADKG